MSTSSRSITEEPASKKMKMTDGRRDSVKYSRFTKEQVEALENQALKNDAPSSEVTMQLARNFEVPVKKVTDWFVNYKYRKGSKARPKDRLMEPAPEMREESAEVESGASESRKARRFPRLTKEQVKVLERELIHGDAPSRETRERLAVEVNAPVQKVSEWFSNRKQRMKKRTLEQESSMEGDDDGDEPTGVWTGNATSQNESSMFGAVVWNPAGNPIQPRRLPIPHAHPTLISTIIPSQVPGQPIPDDRKAALRKVLGDIENSLTELKNLKHGLVSELEEAQAAVSKYHRVDIAKRREFEEIHAEVTKMETLKRKLLSAL